MTPEAVREAASLLVQARRTAVLLDGARLRPADVDGRWRSDATVAALHETVAGWKVGSPLNGKTVRGRSQSR
jgi:hypothetical protein